VHWLTAQVVALGVKSDLAFNLLQLLLLHLLLCPATAGLVNAPSAMEDVLRTASTKRT
jgi:hypothetical protein